MTLFNANFFWPVRGMDVGTYLTACSALFCMVVCVDGRWPVGAAVSARGLFLN